MLRLRRLSPRALFVFPPAGWMSLAFLFATLGAPLSPSPAWADEELQPVQFLISGNAQDADGGAALDHAQVVVLRSGTSELLAERVFTESDGQFTATFQAEVLVQVGLGDGGLPGDQPTTVFGGYWVGQVWPNPMLPNQDLPIAIPYAAPSRLDSDPKLELFDSRGRRVREGQTMASGVYLYRLNFENHVSNTRKLLVLGATRARFELERVASPAAVRAERNRDGGSADKRAEGTLDVDVFVRKPGYVTQQFSTTLDSRVDNQFAATLSAEAPPTAQLSVGGSTFAQASVLFDANGSTAPDGQGLSFSWDFGDGLRGGGTSVAHVYKEAGSYTVELTVSSTFGATATASQIVDIGPAAPAASSDATSNGTVRDAIGNLLEGVSISLVGGSATGVTDSEGKVTLTGLPTGVPIALQCEKDGYTRQVVRLILPANTMNSEFRATLRRQRTAVNVAAIEDGTRLDGEDGVCIELPADALQQSDGSPASGAAGIRMTPVDITSDIESGAFPGAYEGIETDGDRGLLVSFGAAEFVIEQGAEELQLKPGSTALIEIPIYSSGAAVDDIIPLWSVDETTGLWVEEGLGLVVANAESPTGLALRAEVTHFSWWNCDMWLGDPYTVIPECKIKDSNGLPTLQIPPGESCFIQGALSSAGGPTTRPTVNIPPDGGIPIELPPDLDVQLTASTQNGLKRGVAFVNGASGSTDALVIGLDDPDGSPNELSLPVDFEAAIDPEGEVDRYTFEAAAGQFFNVSVSRASGSLLSGDLRVFAPDDSEIHMSSFGTFAASFAHEATQSGSYAIEVDGTADEPGAYRLVVAFSEPYELAIPSFVDEDIAPGFAQVFLVPATAGQWFSVNYLRREAITFGNKATLRVDDPSGATVTETFFNATNFDTGLIQAGETGIYRVYLSSDDVESAYTLFVRDVPEILLGGNAAASIDVQGTQYYRFSANQDDFLRATLAPGPSFSGSIQIVDSNSQQLFGSFLYSLLDGTSPLLIPSTGDYFLKVVASFGGARTIRDYSVALNDIRPPNTLSFDAAGRAEILNGQIGQFGDVRLFQFDANAGDALAVELRPGSLGTLSTGARVQLFRIGAGSVANPEESVFGDFLANHPGDVAAGILEYAAWRDLSTDSYLLAINAPAPEDGGFELTVDRVAQSSNLTVDDDLVDCPSADTRNLIAAALAAQGGATINVCAGDYEYIVSIPLSQPGIELVGSSKDEVTLRYLLRGFVIYGDTLPARIANLTLECSDPINSTALYLRNGSGGIVEDVDIRAAVTTSPLKTGIDLGSGIDGLTIRRVRIDNASIALDGTPDNLLVEDCVFDGASSMVDLQGDLITLQNNTWNLDAVGQAIEIQNSAGHQILNNEITILTSDIGATLKTPAIFLEDDDANGTLPQSVVRGNVIMTNEAGMDLRLDRAGSSILCEQNFVQMTGVGQTAVVMIAQRDAGNEAIIQNNVFNGASYFEGVHLRWADRFGALRFLNNTLRIYTGGVIQPSYPTVRIDLGPGSTFTGALPVLFVNNVLQGRDGGVAIEIPASTTIDADYNLFHQYPIYYANGSTSTGADDLFGQDPLFVGSLLELDPNSPGVDSGADVGDVAEVPTVDFDGDARPAGTGTDRGAHEQ